LVIFKCPTFVYRIIVPAKQPTAEQALAIQEFLAKQERK
jgi:hypothetical protein